MTPKHMEKIFCKSSKNPLAAGDIIDNTHSNMSVALKGLKHISQSLVIVYWADSAKAMTNGH